MMTARAIRRFFHWDLSVSTRTVTPVGMWVITTAFDVLLRAWPPLPEPRVAVHEISESGIVSSPSSITGMTATVTVEV